MKSFKKIIVPAIAVIALCLSLIAGATYAWFTDEAKTNVNTIQSGKLDVALEMKEGDGWVSAEGKTLSFLKMNAEGELVADENVLWEPGCTYKLPLLRIVNNSNVAIKYTVMFNGATGDTQLLDALTFTTKVTRYRPTGSSYNTVYSNFGGQLFAGTIVSKPDENGEGFAFAEMQITVKMKKEAGNEYQNLTISNMAITVKATQAPYEYDSIDNKYDDGLSFEGSLSFENGYASISTGTKVTQPNGVALNVTGANTKVTVNGGDFDGGEGGDNICVWAGNGASLKINKGNFTVGGDASGAGNSTVYATGGANVEIYGGFFKSECEWEGKYYVLNQNNTNPGTITVYGGTFVNQDPSLGDDNLGGNFVAEGYKVISEAHGADTWYTVVADPTTAEQLKSALKFNGNVEVNQEILTAKDDGLSRRTIVAVPTTLTLNKKIVSPDGMGVNRSNYAALFVAADTTINATDEGGINTGTDGAYGIDVIGGATLVINGGNYYGGGTVVQIEKGTLIINGGFFACEPYSDAKYGYKYLINCIDKAWKDGTAKVSITGGTFVNFDPMDSASENPNGNFLAEGYKTVATPQANGDIWYTVVKA